MKVKLKAKQGFSPIRVVRSAPNINKLPVRPRNAINVPSVSHKPIVRVSRPVTKQPIKMPQVRMPQPRKLGSKVDVIRAPKNYQRQRSVSNERPSNLRKNRDKLMGKYTEKIRGLRDIGNNRILVIVSCGPSANDVDIVKLNEHPKIDIACINKPDDRIWPSDYWIFCDQSQYMRNQEYWGNYSGTIINAASVRARHHKQILIRTLAGKGFSRDLLKGIHIGRSTTYVSMQIGLYMGYYKIFILGCDMAKPDVGKPLHRYGNNPDVPEENRIKRFSIEAENFLHGAKSMKDYEKNRFWFCSEQNKWEFINYFNRISQFDAVENILRSSDELLTGEEYNVMQESA